MQRLVVHDIEHLMREGGGINLPSLRGAGACGGPHSALHNTRTDEAVCRRCAKTGD